MTNSIFLNLPSSGPLPMPVKIHKDTAACAATGTMANANNGTSAHQPTREETKESIREEIEESLVCFGGVRYRQILLDLKEQIQDPFSDNQIILDNPDLAREVAGEIMEDPMWLEQYSII